MLANLVALQLRCLIAGGLKLDSRRILRRLERASLERFNLAFGNDGRTLDVMANYASPAPRVETVLQITTITFIILHDCVGLDPLIEAHLSCVFLILLFFQISVV